MLIPSIKIIFRHFRQNKLYAIINTIGLSTGLCCVLLATLFWKDEHGFDDFHKNVANLFRITTRLSENKGEQVHTTGGTSQVQGPAFQAGVPEVAGFVRLLGGGFGGDVLAANKSLHMSLLYSDENFFDLFTFSLLQGNPKTALHDLNSAVITESAAVRLFGTTDVLGRQLELDADPSAQHLGKPMVITGVAKNIPGNSSIQFEVLMPMKFLQLSFDDKNWLNAYLSTFVLLHKDANRKQVVQKFNQIYSSYAREQLAENKKAYGFDPSIQYGLQPITDIHLNPLGMSSESGVVNSSSPVFSYLFMGIAVFILLMAGINFINISIADSLKRAKEVGIRKISGGSRTQIILRFLCESGFLCLLALLLAVLFTNFTLPVFNNLTGKQISFGEIGNGSLVFDMIAILTLIILFTGLYPACILSAFCPKEVLYNRQKNSGAGLFGKFLIVFQFSIAMFLLIATLVFYSQMNFIQTRDLGYNPHEVIQTNIPGDREVQPIYRFLRNELAKEPSVLSISFGGGEASYNVKIKGQVVSAIHKAIDENYLSTMDISLVTGRNFSSQFPSDSIASVMVNEAFVQAAKLDDPIGTQLRVFEYFGKTPKTIVGVVKNYHTGSMREAIRPMVFFMNSWFGGNILVKVDKNHQKEGLSAIGRSFKKAIPRAVYQYHFLDELNAAQYKLETRLQRVIGMATILSIAICCLGLFGLAQLATIRRVKEIGIRKLLGASVTQVVGLLSAGFLKLVVVAILISSPLAWWVMNNWLQQFAYRVQIGVGVFLTAALLSLAVAFITVSLRTVNAASANPADSLRSGT